MFLQNLVKLNNSYFSTEFRPQIQVKTKKKSLRRIVVLS